MDLTFIDRALGSSIPYVTYAVPVFFILMGVELAVALWQHKHTYRLHDSINDLSCGITEQMVGLFLKGLLFAGYLGTYAYATRAGINLVDVESYSPAANGWRRSCSFWASIAPTTGSTASPMNTTPPGPGTSSTIPAKITTSRWPCGRALSRAFSPGSFTCRWHSPAFPRPGLPRCRASTRCTSSGFTLA